MNVSMRILGVLIVIAIVIGIMTMAAYVSQPEEQPGSDLKTTPAKTTVVCYAVLDAEFSRPILEKFSRETPYRVEMVFDTESTKSVGLTNRLIQEGKSGRSRCDVFWNNEVMNTIRLKRAGVLASYRPAAAREFPDAFKDPDGMWTGFAARCRVLIVNTDLVAPAERPQTLADLLKPQWKGQIGLAKPQFGSTATWVTAFFVRDQKAGGSASNLKRLEQLQREGYLKVLGGNKGCAQAVSSSALAMAFTDTDDAVVEQEHGKPVELIYLDGAQDAPGAMFFPNTLSLVKGAPNPAGAKALIEFLLSPAVETILAEGPSAQIPVNPAVKAALRVETPATVKPMPVEWEAVADQYKAAMQWAAQTFGE